MESGKVNNNLDFFLVRSIIAILLCYITLILTGKIADMSFLLGNIEYQVGGTSSIIGQFIFSGFSGNNNIYLLIVLFTALNSFLLIIFINKFIDNKNKLLWRIFLLSPGILIYTNAATKETLFFYPAILFIIFEIKFLLSKELKIGSFLLNIFTRLGLLIFMYAIRGDLSLPYALFFCISLISKNFYFGVLNSKLNLNRLLIISFIIYIAVTYLVSFLLPEYFRNLLNFLLLSFETSKDLYRPLIDIDFIRNPINSLQLQYLALFPTLNELLSKPYKTLIIFDSLLLIYVFLESWKILFKVINSYRIFKKIIMVFFIYIAFIYFAIYGLLGSFNLGSSQRLRVNYLPIGIIFPLILEKEVREKQKKNYFIHK